MAYIPAPGVAQVVMRYQLAGQTLQNTFHVAKADAWSTAELATLIDVFDDWDDGTGDDLRGVGCALAEIRAIDLTTEDGAYAVKPLVPARVGTEVSPLLPANVTFAVQLQTVTRGRGRQGRIFLVGLTDGQVVENSIETAALSDILAAYLALVVAVEAGTPGVMAVMHTVRHGAVLNPREWSAVEGVVARDRTTDSQKNRLPNHKRHKTPTP